MDLKNTAKKFFWADEEEELQEEYSTPRLLKSGHLNIMVRTPKSFADVREYADSLMNGCAIMVSFDAVDAVLKNRILDYLNGVSYIVNASVSAVNDNLLLYAPEQVQIDKPQTARRSGVMSSWLNK